MLILALVAVFAVTMVLGVPVAFCLGLGGLAFIWLSGVVPIAVLPTLMFSGMDSFPLLAIPFFVIAGDVMQRCGILPNLIAFANSLVGHFRGGLAYVVIVTSMMFAGVTGVALAECAAIGSMLAPSMVRQGYPGGFTSAVIAGSAVMGPIIPPSVAMLVFAYVYGGGISVGKLFLMGIVPGVLIGLTMMALVAIQARRRSFPVSGERFSVRRVLRALQGATLGLVVPLIIIGGILGGVFTPTEAGAVATAYGVLVGMFVLRTLSLSDLKKSLLVGAKTSAVIYLLLGTSNVVSWILVRNQVPKVVAQWSLDFTTSAEVFMLVAIGVLFLLGLALEAVPIMIMLIPILAPAAAAYKIDPHLLGLVVVVDLVAERAKNTTKEIEGAGGTALSVVCDVRSEASVRDMVEQTVRTWGRVDVLVNAAGGYTLGTVTHELSVADWDMVMDSNLKGSFLCAKFVLPHMIRAGGGRIINFASNAARTSSPALGVHYTTTKAGVPGLTRHQAKEYASHQILVNTVAPGPAELEPTPEILTREPREQLRREIPLGRYAAPEDISAVVLFLAGEGARHITGATIDVNGGYVMV